MKTRVIQDEPDEQTTTNHRVDEEKSAGRISLRARRAGAPTTVRRRFRLARLCCSAVRSQLRLAA